MTIEVIHLYQESTSDKGRIGRLYSYDEGLHPSSFIESRETCEFSTLMQWIDRIQDRSEAIVVVLASGLLFADSVRDMSRRWRTPVHVVTQDLSIESPYQDLLKVVEHLDEM